MSNLQLQILVILAALVKIGAVYHLSTLTGVDESKFLPAILPTIGISLLGSLVLYPCLIVLMKRYEG
jgi:hypothetical protein